MATTDSSQPLRDAFAAALPPGCEGEAPAEQVLVELMAAAHGAWPGVRSDAPHFLRHVAARLDGEGPVADRLARLRTGDLYLACACLAGDAVALASFDALLVREVEVAWSRIDVPAADASDARQLLRTRLLVAGADAAGTPARLHEYAGRGDLRAWLRVIAVREALQLRRKHGRERSLGPDLFELQVTTDPDIRRLKESYRSDFERAFLDALGELGPRDRNLLRSHHLYGLGIDELSPMFGVHRATVARWLTKLRDQLHDATLRHLSDRLQLTDAELDSVMRLIRSRLEVSLQRALALEAEADQR